MRNFYIDNAQDIRDLQNVEVGYIDTEGSFRTSDEYAKDVHIEERIRKEMREDMLENLEHYRYDSRYMKFTGLSHEYSWDWEKREWRKD